ncbi:hypothetical protein ACWT_3089 [Actinoplanes sp. SE50]|uniref:hypothetical protein n=1 Tax=unclassified Actinoplanes TaxID=2626549 RepID=UPI00023EC293|nr:MULTISPECIES: hypothetical protein [unclassified Actinoplanes]AEV84112.1 hypothetical protein ACPL_3217 [Actinoplanes sp. SE50/110]ATO82504.1 hypothetical protein ACWT_3089 [Actinoplanes sp. SE50]SLL99911.1 hypothetical protein ACSP50_3143 [Actinoplanes sp. SE50/110]
MPFRIHAGHLAALRARLGRIAAGVGEFEQDQAAFGAWCGWILTGLGDRVVRHGELVAYIEETLLLFVQGFHRVADGSETFGAMIGMPVDEDITVYDSATEIIDGVLDTVAAREWVEPLLAEAAPVAEFAAPVGDLVGALRVGGLHWAVTHVPELRQMLDDLAGAPDVVARQADRWGRMATELERIADDLQRCLDHDFRGRSSPEVRGYLAIMSNNVVGLRGLVATSTAMTALTKAAGDLILLTRDIVRGLIGDLIARVAGWSLESEVVPLPLLTARLAVVATTVRRVDAYLNALVVSIANLSRSIGG